MPDPRTAHIQRKTSETDIDITFTLDGSGTCTSETGIGFFDHMLTALARHGLFDLNVTCRGDLDVDTHHTVEDIGICLGQALFQALGNKTGITRFGASYVPMDEALARAVIDLSGRPYLVYHADFAEERIGTFPTILGLEFFRAFSDNARLNLHIDLLRGTNAHHSIEAIFKAVARALRTAVTHDLRVEGIPSTKGTL
ncbi:MAG: imidazoleglycerol-phosphate dehydratase HisB [bacterium]|nr:imidazoleglycerol-phosphate dehydratase HisB [bacterium]